MMTYPLRCGTQHYPAPHLGIPRLPPPPISRRSISHPSERARTDHPIPNRALRTTSSRDQQQRVTGRRRIQMYTSTKVEVGGSGMLEAKPSCVSIACTEEPSPCTHFAGTSQKKKLVGVMEVTFCCCVCAEGARYAPTEMCLIVSDRD